MRKISILKRRAVSLVRLLFQTSTSLLSVPILYSRNKNVIQTHCEPGLATLPTGTILISSTKLIINNKNEPPHLNWSSAMFRKRRTDNDEQTTEAGREVLSDE